MLLKNFENNVFSTEAKSLSLVYEALIKYNNKYYKKDCLKLKSNNIALEIGIKNYKNFY